jgi:hypothetical protein
VQDAMTLRPYEVEVVDVTLVTVIEAYLAFCAIVFQLPVWRRGDNKMNGFVFKFAHLAAVALYYCMFRIQLILNFSDFINKGIRLLFYLSPIPAFVGTCPFNNTADFQLCYSVFGNRNSSVNFFCNIWYADELIITR